MEKYDKDWEDECLPRGPKAPLSPQLAVEEGHALCWPDPGKMKTTWLLRQPSRCSEYRGSLLGFSAQTVRLLPGASRRDQVPTTASCLWVVGNMGSHRAWLDPAFTQQTRPRVCCREGRRGAQRASRADMEMCNRPAQEDGRRRGVGRTTLCCSSRAIRRL